MNDPSHFDIASPAPRRGLGSFLHSWPKRGPILQYRLLAILSACDTNFGPEQRGEGVWALSRGFLVAGARRVVATNWLVDDEAAASLVSYFCSILANAEEAGKAADHAEALQNAKRWVRNNSDHPEWNSPYYWAPFVLVGPN